MIMANVAHRDSCSCLNSSFSANRFGFATLPIQRSKSRPCRLYITSRPRISTSSNSEVNKLRKTCYHNSALIELLAWRWVGGGMFSGVKSRPWGRRVISVSVYYSNGNTQAQWSVVVHIQLGVKDILRNSDPIL